MLVEKDEHCMFIDLQHEILAGSGIIVPRVHRETPFELTESEVASTFQLLREVKVRLDSSLAPDGYNVGWNCGSCAGQKVSHAHLHVIPRFSDEPLAGKGIRYWLTQAVNRRPEATRSTGGAVAARRLA
jgi:diadenosine tetraphosphate (Ap4A) HIT family hydrolase